MGFFSKPPKWLVWVHVKVCMHRHTHTEIHTHSLRIMEDSESTAERVQGDRPVLCGGEG